jgi:hypothetical protein
MLAELLLSQKRLYPCKNVEVGSSEHLRQAEASRSGFRSAVESQALMKQRDRKRLVANHFLQESGRAKARPLSTFPEPVNRNPPPCNGRREDVTLPQIEGGPALVIKYVDDAMRHIFPPLPERTYGQLTVIPPETAGAAVVDTRDLRVKCGWEPYEDEGHQSPAAPRASLERPQPVSPFKERTGIFDVYTPEALPLLLKHLARGPFSKLPIFDPVAELRDKPLKPLERAILASESVRRAAASCPPTIDTLVRQKCMSTSSGKAHAGTVRNRRAMRLRHCTDSKETSSLFTSMNVDHSVRVTEQQPVVPVERKTFGNYLTV